MHVHVSVPKKLELDPISKPPYYSMALHKPHQGIPCKVTMHSFSKMQLVQFTDLYEK